MCSCTIYYYKCMLRNKHSIGSTVRQLSYRIAEHMRISVRTAHPSSTQLYSSIHQHESDTGQRIQKSNLKILSYSNRSSLHTVEALYIHKFKPQLNCGLPVELSLMH